VLRRNRLVLAERRGSLVYYRLAYPQVADLLRVARALLGEILETTQRQLIDQEGLPELSPAPVSA
jgi:ArsR family transcriptional regulator